MSDFEVICKGCFTLGTACGHCKKCKEELAKRNKPVRQLRFYTFTNFYLSSIQQGIQPGHATSELHVKYSKEVGSAAHRLMMDWAVNHKTHIALNGGALGDLLVKYEQLVELAEKAEFPVPYAKFHEDEYSLGGIMTSFGVVVSQELFDAVDYRKACSIFGQNFMAAVDPLDVENHEKSYFFIEDELVKHTFKFGTPAWTLINMLKSCSLAR